MWTVENRKRYERSHLRYPSDLTDEEWQHVEPLIPLAKPGGRKREVNIREVVNGVMYVLSTGCSGGTYQRICPRKARCFTTSIVGTVMERWRLSITTSMSNVGSQQNVMPAPPLPSSTARA